MPHSTERWYLPHLMRQAAWFSWSKSQTTISKKTRDQFSRPLPGLKTTATLQQKYQTQMALSLAKNKKSDNDLCLISKRQQVSCFSWGHWAQSRNTPLTGHHINHRGITHSSRRSTKNHIFQEVGGILESLEEHGQGRTWTHIDRYPSSGLNPGLWRCEATTLPASH